MSKYDEIARRYAEGGVRDDQLDGTGAADGSTYLTRNYARLVPLSAEQVAAIRAGGQDPEVADMLAAINIYEGGDSSGTV